MNMIRIGLNIPSLIRWAHEERSLFPSVDMDMGYLLHAAMRKAFGHLAPQPFFFDSRGSDALLGYGDASREALNEARCRPGQGSTASLTQALVSCDCKAMPDVWPADALLRFNVLACPVRRFHSKGAEGEKRGEKDVFLLDVELAQRLGEPAPSRAQSYLRWMEKELSRDDAATALELRLTGHRLVRPQRRGGRQHKGPASFLGCRPEGHFEGVLRIRDGHAFAALLQRGIGRHRAFGFGMLLVRPV